MYDTAILTFSFEHMGKISCTRRGYNEFGDVYIMSLGSKSPDLD
jgi:hypothetical protein